MKSFLGVAALLFAAPPLVSPHHVCPDIEDAYYACTRSMLSEDDAATCDNCFQAAIPDIDETCDNVCSTIAGCTTCGSCQDVATRLMACYLSETNMCEINCTPPTLAPNIKEKSKSFKKSKSIKSAKSKSLKVRKSAKERKEIPHRIRRF